MKILKKTHNCYYPYSLQSKHTLKFGKFGLKTLSYLLLTKEKIEVLQFLLLRKLKMINSKKKIKIWNYLILNKNLSKLPLESRMGKGKGSIYTQAVFLSPGTVIFEFDNVDLRKLLEVFNFIKKKFNCNVNLVQRY